MLNHEGEETPDVASTYGLCASVDSCPPKLAERAKAGRSSGLHLPVLNGDYGQAAAR
jgi:hypothetical protein